MKWIIRTIVALVLVLAVAGLGAYIYLDTIAQQAIERGGSYATGVATRVASVSVQPVAGQVALHELTIANPEGFGPGAFFALDSGAVQVQLGSLMQERVVIPRLHLKGVHLSIETDAAGRRNYQLVLANLQKLARQPEDQPGKHYLIHELIISDIELRADLPLVRSAGRPITLPDIRLTDVGSRTQQGVVMSELTSIIVQAVLRQAIGRLIETLPNALLGALRLEPTGGGALDEPGDRRSIPAHPAAPPREPVDELPPRE